jgi:hypothetical protein
MARGPGWDRLECGGTGLLQNGALRVRSIAQRSTGVLHVSAKTPAGWTRIAISLETGGVVAVTQGRTSEAAYDAMMKKLRP